MQRLKAIRPPHWVKVAFTFVKKVFERFGKDNGYMLAAALSFYAAFAIFPLLLGLVAILSFVVSPETAIKLVMQNAGRILGGQRSFVADTLAGIRQARGAIGAVSALLLLWSAKSLFQSLSTILDLVDRFEQPQGLLGQVKIQAKALGYALGCGGLALAIGGLYWGIQYLAQSGSAMFSGSMAWLSTLQNGLPIVAFFGGFQLIYRYLPNGRIGWKASAAGSLVGVALWFPVSIALTFYLTNIANLNAVYGPLSGIMAFYIWLNYSTTIVVLAAEVGAVVDGRPDTQALPR